MDNEKFLNVISENTAYTARELNDLYSDSVELAFEIYQPNRLPDYYKNGCIPEYGEPFLKLCEESEFLAKSAFYNNLSPRYGVIYTANSNNRASGMIDLQKLIETLKEEYNIPCYISKLYENIYYFYFNAIPKKEPDNQRNI